MIKERLSKITSCLFNAANIFISDEETNEVFLETGSFTHVIAVDLPNGNRGAIAFKLIDTRIPIKSNISHSSHKMGADELKIILEATGNPKEVKEEEEPAPDKLTDYFVNFCNSQCVFKELCGEAKEHNPAKLPECHAESFYRYLKFQTAEAKE